MRPGVPKRACAGAWHESPIRRQGYRGSDVASPSTAKQPTAGQYRHTSSRSHPRRKTRLGYGARIRVSGVLERLCSVKLCRFKDACVIATAWRPASYRPVMTCDRQRGGGLGRLTAGSDFRKVETGGANGPHTATRMRYHDKSCSLIRFRRWKAVSAGVGSAFPTTPFPHPSPPIPSSTRHPGVYGGEG